jgi:hypothetical protein
MLITILFCGNGTGVILFCGNGTGVILFCGNGTGVTAPASHGDQQRHRQPAVLRGTASPNGDLQPLID